ncbi:T3SS effector HopA1 family protein [Solwaraspora sp. WMMD791]|uniref:T3SS effector HopA1 family protein n=1 Tax=Solwaraspora sp. WMMD791 TaxID=3016086 RepID=UPI00249CEB65|nr:T3SS effector HopA1 family protein [Solwaraspora sp. WMMD791]WFE30315.1 T3SS effector HopA1 family protein [Solwaraspora sp. WMMD791]
MTLHAAPPARPQSPPPHHRLAESVREAVRQIRVSADRTTAVVGGREITAGFPRELRRLLAESIYNVLHSGQPDGQVPTRLRDDALERRLIAAVPHRQIEIRAVARSAVGHDAAGNPRILVEREGLRIWVPPTALTSTHHAPGEPVSLTVPPWRAALSPGFFLVDGSRQRDPGRRVLRVYLHLVDVDHAVQAWGQVLNHLEAHQVPYRAKVLSARELYPRRDAIVVYLTDDHVHVATDLAGLARTLPGTAPQTSVFTDRLAPGVGTAWEPVDTVAGRQGLSFGQHRATVLAAALVEAADDLTRVDPLIVQRFTEAGIDPANPARNLAG